MTLLKSISYLCLTILVVGSIGCAKKENSTSPLKPLSSEEELQVIDYTKSRGDLFQTIDHKLEENQESGGAWSAFTVQTQKHLSLLKSNKNQRSVNEELLKHLSNCKVEEKSWEENPEGNKYINYLIKTLTGEQCLVTVTHKQELKYTKNPSANKLNDEDPIDLEFESLEIETQYASDNHDLHNIIPITSIRRKLVVNENEIGTTTEAVSLPFGKVSESDAYIITAIDQSRINLTFTRRQNHSQFAFKSDAIAILKSSNENEDDWTMESLRLLINNQVVAEEKYAQMHPDLDDTTAEPSHYEAMMKILK